MNLRERIVVKLLVFLIEFIGKPLDGFYGYKLEDIIKEMMYPKLEIEDFKKALQENEE